MTDEKEIVRFLEDTEEYFHLTTEEFLRLSSRDRLEMVRQYLEMQNNYYASHDLSSRQKGIIIRIINKYFRR